MTTTLRRKLIQKLSEVLENKTFSLVGTDLADSDAIWGTEKVSELSALLADAALEVFNEKPKIDLAKSDPAWAILFGDKNDVEGALDESKRIKAARDSFEMHMGFNPLPWDSTKDWQKMSKFVVQEYEKDNLIFAKYKTWQKEDGKYVALSNRKIKERPGDFIACFPDFLAHTAMYPKVEKIEDDNDDFEFKNEIYI